MIESFRDRLIKFLKSQPDISFPVEIYDDIDLGRFVKRMLEYDTHKEALKELAQEAEDLNI